MKRRIVRLALFVGVAVGVELLLGRLLARQEPLVAVFSGRYSVVALLGAALVSRLFLFFVVPGIVLDSLWAAFRASREAPPPRQS
ncbi:MAG: hypothetical protein U0263_28545 [Polyangiaceae bacterium]